MKFSLYLGLALLSLFLFCEKAVACKGVEIKVIAVDQVPIQSVEVISVSALAANIVTEKNEDGYFACLEASMFHDISASWEVSVIGDDLFSVTFNLTLLNPINEKLHRTILLKVFQPELDLAFGSEVVKRHTQSYSGYARRWENYYYCKKAYEKAKNIKNFDAQYEAGMCWYYASLNIAKLSQGTINIDKMMVDEFEQVLIPAINVKSKFPSSLKKAWYKSGKNQRRFNNIDEEILSAKLLSWIQYGNGGYFHHNDDRQSFCKFLKYYDTQLERINSSDIDKLKTVFSETQLSAYKTQRGKFASYAEKTLGLQISADNCGL